MKKLGILTFQFADNYGAVLQCYALKKVLESFSEFDVDIINYIPPAFKYAKRWQNDYEYTLFLKKRKSFDSFLDKHCSVKKPIFHAVPDNYDYYVVGSDQIWNTSKNFDAYFLCDLHNDSKKIAYAPSIGRDVFDPRLRKEFLISNLKKFDFISVREQIHSDFIMQTIGRDCPCVLDPTLLLKPEKYDHLVAKNRLVDRDFVFFFWLKNDKTLLQGVEFVNDISRAFGLPIVHSINDAPDYMFNNSACCMQFDPIENFLWYIKNASYVVTNSYHATIFSILFKKKFYTFQVESMKSRTDTLSLKLGVDERIVAAYTRDVNFDDEINYDCVFDNINKEQKLSFAYLENALKIV